MKNLSKRQEMIDIQQKIYLIIFTMKNINPLPLIHQDIQIQAFLNNLQQYWWWCSNVFYRLKAAKNYPKLLT